MNEDPQRDPNGDPMVALEMSNSMEDSYYWKIFIIELMKRISPARPVLSENFSKSDKLTGGVARRNPKVYDGNVDPVELEDWIRGIKKIFAVVEVPVKDIW